MSARHTVGQALPHDSARLHVTGAARYTDDLPAPANCLHLCFGQSPKARGKLRGLDLAAVRAAPGVIAVLTAEDLPAENNVSPSLIAEPLLAVGRVEYLGQPVFIVIAESHLAARKAARLGQVEIEPEEPILTIDQALDQGSYFEEAPLIWGRGDAEAALEQADHIIEGSLNIGGQEHFYLEAQAAMALPQEAGDMVVHSSTQHPTEIQHKVADALGVPMHAIRVETRRMGGGFGGKESQGNHLAVACAVAAQATGRPCRMRYDRDDDMMLTGKRHDFRVNYRAGVMADGRLSGVSVQHYVRCGWALDLSLPVADRAMLHADNAYLLPDIRIESHRLRTNTQSATAFRGFGGPQGMLGIERIMDHCAHQLGMDPVALRQRNYYAPAGTKPSRPNLTPYGMEVRDFVLDEMTERLLESSDYHTRRTAIEAWNAENPLLRRGLGFSPVKFGISFTLTHLNQAGALVHVYQDGSIHLNHGGTEMGQGLFQKVAQVAAEIFAVPVGTIRITATDTGKVPNTSATAASSGSDLNGMAVKAACEAIRDRMRDCLAEKYGAPVTFEDGQVICGRRTLTFAAAAAAAYQARVSLSSTGFYKTPDLSWDRVQGTGRPFFYFAYGAALTEVVVDRLTGENRILRADILHDAGASLNPALDIGQIEGGYVQGAGWLTTEELVWDDQGRLRTHAPSTYKIPACSDRPRIFNVALWDGPNPEETIYRSKAVGEPPFMLGISAWLALADAVGTFGAAYPDLQSPATPEAVLAAITRAAR